MRKIIHKSIYYQTKRIKKTSFLLYLHGKLNNCPNLAVNSKIMRKFVPKLTYLESWQEVKKHFPYWRR